MSPALNESSALQHFECGNAVKIRNGIMFDSYLGLPHVTYTNNRNRSFDSWYWIVTYFSHTSVHTHTHTLLLFCAQNYMQMSSDYYSWPQSSSVSNESASSRIFQRSVSAQVGKKDSTISRPSLAPLWSITVYNTASDQKLESGKAWEQG